MLQQSFLLILFLLANVSAGFTQNIADRARNERARRDALAGSAASADPGAMPVGREALMEEALGVSGARRQLEQVLETSLQSFANDKRPEGVSPQEYQQIITEAFDVERLIETGSAAGRRNTGNGQNGPDVALGRDVHL